MGKFKDLTGQRFGRLVAVCRVIINRRTMWLCVCDCGKKNHIRADSLTSGVAKSCGCFKRDSAANRMATFNIRYREKIKKNRETGIKKCASCKSIKRINEFRKRINSVDGLQSHCKSCEKKYKQSDSGTLSSAKWLLKNKAPIDIELPPELIEARAELIKIRRKIKEMTK